MCDLVERRNNRKTGKAAAAEVGWKGGEGAGAAGEGEGTGAGDEAGMAAAAGARGLTFSRGKGRKGAACVMARSYGKSTRARLGVGDDDKRCRIDEPSTAVATAKAWRCRLKPAEPQV